MHIPTAPLNHLYCPLLISKHIKMDFRRKSFWEKVVGKNFSAIKLLLLNFSVLLFFSDFHAIATRPSHFLPPNPCFISLIEQPLIQAPILPLRSVSFTVVRHIHFIHFSLILENCISEKVHLGVLVAKNLWRC